MLGKDVEAAVQRALDDAQSRRHEFATVEHLCLSLFNEPKIRNLLSQLGVLVSSLEERFVEFLAYKIKKAPEGVEIESLPSLGFQRVLQRAALQVLSAGKQEVSVEHVLVAAFDEEESYAVHIMNEAGISRLDLVSVLSHGFFGLDKTYFDHSLEEESEGGGFNEPPGSPKRDVLSAFSVCLTEMARKKMLDPIIGRKTELSRAIHILCRRRKNNPLFVGEAGVGKTALAEGLAQLIVSGRVPEKLKGAEMYLLDMGALLAGARYRGDFENRLKMVLSAIEAKPKAIAVIDEIHTLIGAGATSGGSMDASNLLKPALNDGHFRCIGSTTYREYRTYFEKDRALVRRFQKIDVDEPSEEDCISILKGLSKEYEQFHNVTIDEEAFKEAVQLSVRYVHEKKLPDKAIDLIDEACAALHLSLEGEGGKVPLVTKNHIEEAVSKIAQIPSKQITRNDEESLLNLKDKLQSSVFGQSHAVEKVANAVLCARAGLRDKEKPIASFLFTGPSGVGKTELAKQLAQVLGIAFIRFDMSEYMERHAASRLVGAPPGYVGFEQGGLLTDALHKTPYAVLLLDEIEKAHPDVFNILLQVMDYGRLTDSNGRPTDFRHTILIMTSNVGARELEQRPLGFLSGETKVSDEGAVRRLFSPEFRNRLDGRITFRALDKKAMESIVDKFMNELSQQLKERQVQLAVLPNAKTYLAQKGYDPALGARPLSRLIQDEIKTPLIKELLFGHLKQGGQCIVDCHNGTLILKSVPKKQKSKADSTIV